jgi:hypothetical protein
MVRKFLVLVAAAAALAASSVARAEELVAIRADGAIVRFDSAAPGTFTSVHDVSGLAGGEFLVGIDVRPTDGVVFGVGSTSRLYQVDPATGTALRVGSATFTPSLDGNDFGVAFDLTGSTLRVTSDTGQNVLLEPETGQTLSTDGRPTYAVGDANAGATAGVTACGWRWSPSSVALYGVDLARRLLVKIDNPPSGAVSTVGALGTGALLDGGYVGLDASMESGATYMVAALAGETTSRLYRIEVATGAATSLGALTAYVRGAAVMPSAPPAPPGTRLLCLVAPSTIVTVTTDKPQQAVRTLHVTGLPLGASLVGVAVRPSNGRLYAITRNALFDVQSLDGSSERVGAGFSVELPAGPLSCDFDPVTGKLRVVGGSTTNLRVDADSGDIVDADVDAAGVQTDAPFAFAAGDAFGSGAATVGAIAFVGRTTQLQPSKAYVLETGAALLARLGDAADAPDEARDGRLHSVGPLAIQDVVSLPPQLGLVATSERTAYMALATSPSSSALHLVNLTTGAATFVGPMASSGVVAGLSLEPTANPPRVKVTKISAKLDFRKAGKDSITLKGVTPFPVGGLLGKVVTVDLDGDSKTFTLDAKGKGKVGDDVLRLAGLVGVGQIKMTLTWKKEPLVGFLADQQMDGTTFARRAPRQVAVAITYDGHTYRTLADVAYSVKKPGKTGTFVTF